MSASRPRFFGYVKVDLRSRSPRRWGWSIHREAVENAALLQSDRAFSAAEDAWREGRKVLAAMEDGSKPVAALELAEAD